MTRRHTRALAASAAALVAVTLSACASSDRESGDNEGGGEQTGGTFVFGAAGDPAMLDPAFGSDGETFRVSRQIFEGLLGNELGGTEAVPELAEDWEVSEDGLEYTFNLQQDVKFHDGTDFNAGPDAPELAPLRECFADAWTLATERDDQARWRFWQRQEGLTHPARSPHVRIDQVWVTPGIAVGGARVLDGGGASDHLPLAVDLLVPSGV